MADIKIDDTVDITDVVCPVTFVKAYFTQNGYYVVYNKTI